MTRGLLWIVGLTLLAACGGSSSSTTVVDPASVAVLAEALVPMKDACHVTGRARNLTTDLTVDVTLRWQAFDAADKSLGTTAVLIGRLLPEEERAFEATGFHSSSGLVRCSAITRFVLTETTLVRR